jgi:Sec-independent protein secretion pathway component TatC
VTMLVEMAPLIVLYELSIVLARIFGRQAEGRLPEPSTQER